jgi:hypothetical protein
LNPGQKAHGLRVLDIRPDLICLSRLVSFPFFFKANLFYIMFYFFLEFWLIIFYGLSSMVLVLSSWLESSISNVNIRGVHFRFGSVFIKKNNQTDFFLKKTETGSNRPVLVRFCRAKTGSNQFGSVLFGSGPVRFFWFQV